MGRNKQSKRKAKRAAFEATLFGEVPAGDCKPRFTVDQLLNKAEECIDEFNYEVGEKFCQRALSIEPDNIRGLETSGSLYLELGNIESARKRFSRAVELNPDSGHAKYMYLGQISTGEEAVHFFQKGIHLMVQEVEKRQNGKEIASAYTSNESVITARDISSAHCSIAELYMTDCCDEDSAEEKCRENIEAGIQTDNTNPDAYQLKASFCLLKQDKSNAKEMIQKSLSLWLPQYKEAVEKAEAAAANDPVQLTELSYQSRVNASKILIEVEEYDTASELLELLLDEDDEIIHVWYLLGWLNHLQGEDYKGNARFYLKKATEVAKKVGCDEEGMLQHIQELLSQLGEDDEENNDEADDHDIDIKSDSEEEMEQ